LVLPGYNYLEGYQGDTPNTREEMILLHL